MDAAGEASERCRMLVQACEQAIAVVRNELEETDLQRFFPHLADNPALVEKSAQKSAAFWTENASAAVIRQIEQDQVREKLEELLILEQAAAERKQRHQDGSTAPGDQPAPKSLSAREFMEFRLQQDKAQYLAALKDRREQVAAERAALESAAAAKLRVLSEALAQAR